MTKNIIKTQVLYFFFYKCIDNQTILKVTINGFYVKFACMVSMFSWFSFYWLFEMRSSVAENLGEI